MLTLQQGIFLQLITFIQFIDNPSHKYKRPLLQQKKLLNPCHGKLKWLRCDTIKNTKDTHALNHIPTYMR